MKFHEHGLLPADLEDTIDKATELLRPYRGAVAMMEIWKNILMCIFFIVFFIVAIIVGLAEESWLWCGFVMVIYMVILIPTVYFMKYAYNRYLRQSHFLLAIFCRAENNRHYLNLGLELRPGFLGKWIEISIVNTEGHPDVISYFKSRFLKPAIDLRTKHVERQMYKDQNFVR
jgi:hypothetical protein